MVRAQVKATPEEKKETQKKKTPQKKKSAETGVWPCKINGCNKQFAREADLKRHQRTTKLHSMPGFACPQCDATFTRTDALRRHQKSRHNGVIIEPADPDKKKGKSEEEGASPSGSKSKSPSASPSSKEKENPPSTQAPPSALAQPGTAGPASGPHSYYRQHTMNGGMYDTPASAPMHSYPPVYVPPPPPGMVMDGQYPQGIGLPTSATRLHQANWPPPPPWAPDGSQPQMGPMSYHQVPGPHPAYYASPYYRTSMMPPHPPPPHQPQINPELVAQSQMQNGGHSQPPQSDGSSRTGTPVMSSIQNNVDPRLSQAEPGPSQQDGGMTISERSTESGQKPMPVAPVIDPSLDMSPATQGTNPNMSEVKSVSMEITQAAMEAVLESAKRESSLAGTHSTASGTPEVGSARQLQTEPIREQAPQEADMEGDVDAEGETEGVQEDDIPLTRESSSAGDGGIPGSDVPAYTGTVSQPQTLDRPEPMEQMLTEDGEPMLNPAELLTQESLASPPPS